MKILHVNNSDRKGGAARAAYRIHEALNLHGENVTSEMLVLKKESDDRDIYSVSESIFHKGRPFLERLLLWRYRNMKYGSFSVSGIPFSGVANKIKELNPDLVHLHWVNGGLIRIEDLLKIDKPIVWSLHDMWAFTGGCHISKGCEKYTTQCEKCPDLRSNKKKDLSFKTFRRKEKVYSDLNVTVIGLSKWLTRCAQKSILFDDKKVINLPNTIDSNKFEPVDKKFARDVLKLPAEKKLILFGAMNAKSDPNKGYKYLREAISQIDRTNTEVVTFGGGDLESINYSKFNDHSLGRLQDDTSLKLIYSAADVVVVPSLQENLSNVIMESLSCGTPVVGFDIGGNGDMIEHKKNGYLAKPYITSDLAAGIEWVLSSSDYKSLCNNSRLKVCREFDYNIVAEKYVEQYKEILK